MCQNLAPTHRRLRHLDKTPTSSGCWGGFSDKRSGFARCPNLPSLKLSSPGFSGPGWVVWGHPGRQGGRGFSCPL